MAWAWVDNSQNASGGNTGFEATNWAAATIFRPLESQKRVRELNEQ